MSDTNGTQVDLDLDAERPATFRLQGEVFRLKQLSYRAFALADKTFMDKLAAIDDAADADEAELDAKAKAADEAGTELDPEVLDIAAGRRTARWSEQLDAFAEFVAANLADEDLPKFGQLRSRDEYGIQQRDMHHLRRWLWEAQIGRPLASAVASSPGPGSSEASSRDESGSTAVIRPG